MNIIFKKLIPILVIASLVFSPFLNFATPKAYAQTNPPPASEASTTGMPACEITSLAQTFSGCVARGFYYIFFVPTSFLFSLSGQLMDFSMAYTLNSANYGKTSDGSSFVEKGWTITRDLSNLMFIVILMWIAIKMILGMGSDKKLLGTIILVGLLINFSLFFARIIIDASNILGKIFYDNMGVETGGTNNVYNPWVSQGDKSISIAIVSNFNPQKLFSQSADIKINTGSGVVEEAPPSAGPFIIITLIMSIINLVGMYVFFVIAFVLIGRVIGLWILMIFAPIAFISYILPDSAASKMDKMHHKVWWPELMQQSFVVPIFLFFLYLILLFMNTSFLKGFRTFDGTTAGGILDVIVPLIIITILLTKAKDIATKMSGDVGQAFAKAGSAVGGFALGGAIGAYGKLGRAALGRAGQRVAESETLMNLQRRGGAVGSLAQGIRGGAKAVGSSSFDARGVSGITGALKGANISDFGGAQKDGYKGYVERQDKKQKTTAEELIKGSVNDETKQDVRRARRNLDVLLQTHGTDYDAKKKALQSARDDFKQVKDDGFKDTSDEWKKAKQKVDDQKEELDNFKKEKGIKDAEGNLRGVEKLDKDEEERRKRGQAQDIEATRPKTPEEISKISAENKKRKDAIEEIDKKIKDEKIDPSSDEYKVLQKDKENFQNGIDQSSYSKKNIGLRAVRRFVTGSEHNQTGSHNTADGIRKGLKDDKKSDDKK